MKFLIIMMVVFLNGCASGTLCQRMGCFGEQRMAFIEEHIYESKDAPGDDTLRRRLGELEEFRYCYIGRINSPTCDNQRENSYP